MKAKDLKKAKATRIEVEFKLKIKDATEDEQANEDWLNLIDLKANMKNFVSSKKKAIHQSLKTNVYEVHFIVHTKDDDPFVDEYYKDGVLDIKIS